MTTLPDVTPRPRDWDSVTKTLHWAMAILIPLAWFLAIILEDLSKETRGTVMFFHKSIGAAIIVLLVLRVVWRLTHASPAPEKTRFDPLAQWAAKAGHLVLYALMVLVPIGGVMASFASARPVPFFGLFQIASPWAEKQAFAGQIGGMHETFAHLLLIVALGHAVIGILHHVVLKDRTLMKMRPFARD